MHRCLFLLVLLLSGGVATAQSPAPRDIVINEIAYDPPAPQASGNEWVELFNRSDQTFDLSQLTFSDAGASVAIPSGTLGPGDYAVLVNDATEFQTYYPGVPFIEVNLPALNNTGDVLSILDGATVIDQVPYQSSWGGTDASLERRDPDGPSDSASNWATTTDPDGGTPGAVNSVFAPDTEPPALVGATALSATEVEVVFSEPVDATTASDTGNYSLDNGIGSPSAVAVAPGGDAARVVLTLAVPLQPNTSYTLTVSGVADLAGNVLQNGQTSVFFGQGAVPEPRDLVVNEFLYNEPSDDNPAEYVELFNRSDRTFDLAEFSLSDLTGTITLSDAPVFIAPGEYAVFVEDGASFAAIFPGVPFTEPSSWRALNDSGDAIVIRHDSGVTVDSLVYSPLWGGEDASLERKDPDGPSAFAVNWATTLTPPGTPGAQNSVFAPDTFGPEITRVTITDGGVMLLVAFDEPLDAASVSASAFALMAAEGGTPSITGAAFVEPSSVRLTLSGALSPGDYMLTATGIRDLVGNASASPFAFIFAPDQTPPSLALAFVVDSVTVEVRFSEPVTPETAGDPGSYSVDNDVGSPSAVAHPFSGDSTRARLTFDAPLQERIPYTLTVTGVADPDGNVLLSATALLFLGEGDTAEPGDLVINEIMYDPLGGSDGEYVELFNRTDKLFDLRTLVLTDDDDRDPLAEVPVIVPPNGYVVLVADRDSFAVRFPDAPPPVFESSALPGLNNDGDMLTLLYGGTVIDAVTYDPDWHRVELEDATGISLERISPEGPSNDATNWSSSLDARAGTPGAMNSLFVTPGPPPEGIGLEADSPFDPDAGQSTTLRYVLETDAALVRVRIFDGAGRLVRRLEDGDLVGQTGTLLWDGRGDDGRRLRIGPYVVLLEAVNVEGGTSEAHRTVVVLARQF